MLSTDDIILKKNTIKELSEKQTFLRAQIRQLERPCQIIRKLDENRTKLEQEAALLRSLKEGTKEYEEQIRIRIDRLTMIERLTRELPAGTDEKFTLQRFMELRDQFYDLENKMVEIRKELIADAKAKRA